MFAGRSDLTGLHLLLHGLWMTKGPEPRLNCRIEFQLVSRVYRGSADVYLFLFQLYFFSSSSFHLVSSDNITYIIYIGTYFIHAYTALYYTERLFRRTYYVKF